MWDLFCLVESMENQSGLCGEATTSKKCNFVVNVSNSVPAYCLSEVCGHVVLLLLLILFIWQGIIKLPTIESKNI